MPWSNKARVSQVLACALEPRATAAELTCCNYGRLLFREPALHSRRSHRSEKHAHCDPRAAPGHHSQRRAAQQGSLSTATDK